LLETVDHEIALLIIVDAIAGTHQPLEVEAEAIGRRIVQRKFGLPLGGNDAGAIEFEAIILSDQAEFHGVPIEPCQPLDRPQRMGA
ncbi:hypothetical protein LTR94_035465, partial [Friedmanniomyces endolithicus]